MYRENYRLRTNPKVVAILREKQLCCITLRGAHCTVGRVFASRLRLRSRNPLWDLGDCVRVVACSVIPNIPDKKPQCQAFFAVTPINAGYEAPTASKTSLAVPLRPPHRYGRCSRSGAAACRACCAKPPCFADERLPDQCRLPR